MSPSYHDPDNDVGFDTNTRATEHERLYKNAITETEQYQETVRKSEKRKSKIFAAIHNQLKFEITKYRKLENEIREQKINHEQEIARLHNIVTENKMKTWCKECRHESHMPEMPKFCGLDCKLKWYFDLDYSSPISKNNHS